MNSIRETTAVSGMKEAFLACAARIPGEDDTIVVDCGATTARLTHRPPFVMRLTVVCYALDIAEPPAANPNAPGIRFGGRFGA